MCSLLKMFMPETHFSADYNGLKLLLLLSRLVEKSNIVAQFVRQQFRLDEGEAVAAMADAQKCSVCWRRQT